MWKELRPCVSNCVREAWGRCRDDTGLKAEEKRVLVRRMYSDWRSAQWQLNDLRSVDSVSINQTALSCLPPFSPSFFLEAQFFLLSPTPKQEEDTLVCLWLLFSLSPSPFRHHLILQSLPSHAL